MLTSNPKGIALADHWKAAGVIRDLGINNLVPLAPNPNQSETSARISAL